MRQPSLLYLRGSQKIRGLVVEETQSALLDTKRPFFGERLLFSKAESAHHVIPAKAGIQ
jgi:hypothetical protein